jgi:hypothetical protein
VIKDINKPDLILMLDGEIISTHRDEVYAIVAAEQNGAGDYTLLRPDATIIVEDCEEPPVDPPVDPEPPVGDLPYGDISALQNLGLLPSYSTNLPAPALNTDIEWGGMGGERPEIGLFPEDHAGVIGGHKLAIVDVALADTIPAQPSHAHKPNAHWLPYLLTGNSAFVTKAESVHAEFLERRAYQGGINGFRNYYSAREWAWTMRDAAQLAYLEGKGLTQGTGYINFMDKTLEWALEMINPESTAWEQHNDPRYKAWRRRFRMLSTNNTNSFKGWSTVWWMERFIGVTLQHILALGFDGWRPVAEWHFQQLKKRIETWGIKGCDVNEMYQNMFWTQVYDGPKPTTAAEAYPILDLQQWDTIPPVWNVDRAVFDAVPDGELVPLDARGETGNLITHTQRAQYDFMWATLAAGNGIAGAQEIADQIGAALARRGDAWWYRVAVGQAVDVPPPVDPDPPVGSHWRSNIPAGTWAEVPAKNTISDLNPRYNAAMNPVYPNPPPWDGVVGQKAVVSAWCGAVLDKETSRFALPLGGGHGDYGGNEAYVIDLSEDSPEWVMPRPPSGAVGNELVTDDGQEQSGRYSDGRIRAIHSGNKPVHVPGMGWVLAPPGDFYRLATGGPGKVVVIDDQTGEIVDEGPWPGVFIKASGSTYDPTRHCIWHKPAGTSRFFRYSLDSKTWSQHGPTTAVSSSAGILWLPQDVIIWFNANFPNGFAVYDIQSGQVNTDPAVSGNPIGAGPRAEAQPTYVTPDNRVAWWDQGSATQVINYLDIPSDLVNGVWSFGQYPTGGVIPTQRTQRGTYGRFQYVPNLDGFVLLNSTEQPLYFYARG